MSGISKKGFTLIELMVVIIIMGLLGTIIVPNLQGLKKGYERKLFIEHLNRLVSSAWFNALATHTVHKVVFDIKNRTVATEVLQAQTSEKTQSTSANIPSYFQAKSFEWPSIIEVKEFFIDGKNDIGVTGRTTTKVWFFITSGKSQEVIINLIDSSQQLSDGTMSRFSLVLNPFIPRFVEHDTFQKS